MVDAWAIDSSSGLPSYSGQELRYVTVAPFTAGAGSSLGVRTGVRPSGSGTDLLVQAQASPNMSVLVNPGIIIAQGTYTASQGPYTWALDTQTTLTITASHATLDRTDLVCVRIRDANVDSSGQRDGSVMVVTGTPGSGTPALPTDATYVTIAQISVPHASTSVTSGQITDKRPFTCATGGSIPWSGTAPTNMPPGQLNHDTANVRQYVWTGSTNRRLLDDTMGKGLIYAKRKVDNGDLAAGFTTETTFFTKTVTVEPNRVYDIVTVCPIFPQNANSLVRVRIKEGSTQLSESGPTSLPAGGSTTNVRASYPYTTGAAQTSMTITVTGELTAGGGTATCRGWSSMPFLFEVYDVTGQTSLVEA